MQAPELPERDASLVLLGCFEVAGTAVAIEVSQLREIVRHRSATPLPGAPGRIEGVIDLRGTLVPVVDLGRLLGGEPLRVGRRSRIAVVEVDEIAIGLAVDAAIQILAVPSDALADPPALAMQSGCGVTRALVRRSEGPPIAVLSLEHLVERLYRDALADAEDAP